LVCVLYAPTEEDERVNELETHWDAVDGYLAEAVVREDEVLTRASAAAHAAGLPQIEVAPNQGKFLALLCALSRARRVLEFGTLGGYSTLWMARELGADGHVTTLELDARHAEVARANFAAAGLADRIRLIEGPAADSVDALISSGEQPFDLVFIDADKPNNARYVEQAVQLTHPGSVIVVDNVIRQGEIVDAASSDERVQGSRAVLELLGRHDRLDATAVQTVGSKGWDGFAIAVVRDGSR
jgi:predicted O-methyltransferase YrrM